MISAARFIVQSRYRDDWLAARQTGVTATAVALAATPAGFEQAVRERRGLSVRTETAEMQFGSEAERHIIQYAHDEFGLLDNDWLIAGVDRRHLGTPDALSVDHTRIGEAKTGSTIPNSVPRIHRDQDLWNMWVTGAYECVHLFNQRVPDGDWFRLGLWEPVVFVVERDDKRIAELVEVAERLMETDNEYPY